VGVDLSPDMLAKARRKLPLPERQVTLVQGDAQNLLVEEAAFDAVIFNLILSVIPDGTACLRSALRALKPGGRGVIFDKFLPDDRQPGLVRRVLNRFSTVLGTDINRRLGDLLTGTGWKILRDTPSIFHGTYRVVLVNQQGNGSPR
jgi:phosphatidylethanolamine/phosphatidyl-N-methylethanolamine N-methyltransferase